MLAVLYDVNVRTVNEHLKNIFADSELQEEAVIRKFRITASDGKNYNTNHYNLSAIIAVGYKVNSERAVQFRKWATGIIKEYTIKAYVMDDERLKNDGSILGKKYFEEQLERIREIRLSERKFYQKITAYLFDDIYDFAGKVRTVNIAKGNFRFAPLMYLQHSLAHIDTMLQGTVEEIIEKYVEMNIAHPFREGNDRATRIWLDLILKTEIKQVADWNLVDKEDYLSAMQRSVVKDIELKPCLNKPSRIKLMTVLCL